MNYICLNRALLGIAAAACLMVAAPQAQAQAKPAAGTLNIKINYTGSGTVDDKHQIVIFLFDSPDFVKGEGMPFLSKFATSKSETVKIEDVTTSPVYIAVAYAPDGSYDGTSGPPPSGSSLGMYMKEPPAPAPIKIEPGKAVGVTVQFDDSTKMN
ncbi:MAG: hypothetical protein ABI693_00745 [Bryobacteraceae bacterium]